MTALSQHWRRLAVVLVVVVSSVAWGVPVGSDSVAAAPASLTDDTVDAGEQVVVSQSEGERDRQRPRRFVDADTDDELPVTVYVNETVDISSVTLNGSSSSIGDGRVFLRDIDDKGVVDLNATDADFGGVEPGAYSADDNDSPEIRVEKTRISGLSLYASKDAEDEILSGRIDGGDTVYLNPVWNFDEADKLELTVTDPNGLDVTTQVVDPSESDSPTDVVDAAVGDGFVAESGQDIALNFTGAVAGEYTISASGSDFGPTESTTLTLVRDPVSLSFETDPVFRGDTAVGNVSGLSGQTVYVRVDDGELTDEIPGIRNSDGDVAVTNATASKLFYGGDVTPVGGDSLGISIVSDASDDLVAVVDLGTDGEARFGVRTTYLDAPGETRFTLATTSATGSLAHRIRAGETIDEPTLNVSRRTLDIQSAPDAVATTDEFTITGTAAGVDEVALYERRNDGWHPVDETTGDHVVPVTNGTFRFETAADGRFALPNSYLLGVVSVEAVEQARSEPIDQTPVIPKVAWTDLQPRTSLAIRTESGSLSAYLGSDSLVVDNGVADELQLFGSASGQGDDLRLYIIGPRGTLYADDLTGRSVDVANESIYYTFGESLTRQGRYHVILVGRGRDGSFEPERVSLRPLESNRRTAAQKVAIIRDTYQQPGSDDQLVAMEFQAVDPVVTIDSVGQRDRVPPAEVTITGTTNRGGDRQVFISVYDANGTIAAATNGEVDATSDRWQGSLNFSDLDPGTYTVVASGPDTQTRRQIMVVPLAMPAQQPAPEGTPAESGSTATDDTESGQSTSEPMAPSLGFIQSIPLVIVVFAAATVLSFVLLLRFRGDS